MKIRFKKSTKVVFRGTLLSPGTNNECELPKALNNNVLIGKLLSRFRFLELVPEEGEVPESDISNQSTEGQEPKSDEVINPESNSEIDEPTEVADIEVESESQDSTEAANPEVAEPELESGTQDSTEAANPEVAEPELESGTQDSTEGSAEGEVESKD